MKNPSQRTKILLGVVAAVIVIAVAVVVLAPAAGMPLFGAAALAITPSNPTLAVAVTTDLSVNAVYNCNWFSSNESIVAFTTSTKAVKNVTVVGLGVGSVTIEARCGILNVNHVSTIVAVHLPPPPVISPANPVMPGTGQSVSLSTGDPSCNWAGPDFVTVSPASGAAVSVTGVSGGNATITATCAGGSTATIVSVWPVITVSTTSLPFNTQRFNLSVGETGQNCQWPPTNDFFFLPDTGTATVGYVRSSYEWDYTAPVTVMCHNGTATITMSLQGCRTVNACGVY